MARCALIRDSDGVVVNTIDADDTYTPEPGFSVMVSPVGSIGQRWDGTKFVDMPHPVVVPEVIESWRAKAVLDEDGLLARADALAAAAGPPIAHFWASNVPIRRDSETLRMMASHLGITDAQLDQLFIRAAAINI